MIQVRRVHVPLPVGSPPGLGGFPPRLGWWWFGLGELAVQVPLLRRGIEVSSWSSWYRYSRFSALSAENLWRPVRDRQVDPDETGVDRITEPQAEQAKDLAVLSLGHPRLCVEDDAH